MWVFLSMICWRFGIFFVRKFVKEGGFVVLTKVR